jgi:hypothetical protein
VYSILFVGTDPSLTILHSQILISHGFSVVNVSHIPYADPVFHSARFDAVILCYKATESLSKAQLSSLVSKFGSSPVLIFTKQGPANSQELLPIFHPRHSRRNPRTDQVISDLQEIFRLKKSVPGSLQSWKEISAYMKRGVRTVQRWEKSFGLPVHRPSRHDRSAVFALIPEIEEWMRKAYTTDRLIHKKPEGASSEHIHLHPPVRRIA